MNLMKNTKKQLVAIINNKDEKEKTLEGNLEHYKLEVQSLQEELKEARVNEKEFTALLKTVYSMEKTMSNCIPLSAVKSQNIYNRIKFFLADYLEMHGVWKSSFFFSFLFVAYILNTVLVAKGVWCYLGGEDTTSWASVGYEVTVWYYFISMLILISKVRHTISKN